MCDLSYKNGLPLVNYHLKRILFVFNFLSWLAGLAMLCIGIYANMFKAFQATYTRDLSLNPVTPILILGSALFVVTFFGCVGSLRENLCMLRFFSYALAVALAIEICVAFTILVSSSTVKYHIEKLMRKSIVHYRDDPDLQNIVDWGQETFQCCGVYGTEDWSANIYFNCSERNPSMERCGVPYSCCALPLDGPVDTLCGIDGQNYENPLYDDGGVLMYKEGCLVAFYLWMQSNMFVLFCVFVLFVCLPQVFGLLITRILVIEIKDQDFYTKIGLLNPRGELDIL